MTITLATRAAPNVIRRLTLTLFAGQSIASLGMTAAITVSSIAAAQLMGTTVFAGLPSTMYTLGTALGAYPAGRLMERYGRRSGLALGFAVGVIGALIGALSLVALLPLGLFLAYACMGVSRGALDQGRFAAGDLVTQEHRARSIGWVVLGGTVGGIGGPLLVGPASRLVAPFGIEPLAGPYLAGALFFGVGIALMLAFLHPDPREIGRQLARAATVVTDLQPARTFREALRAVNVQTAVAAMVLGQVVMTTVMVMTPLQLTQHLRETLDGVSIVIAAHVTGMYATSVLTGRVADRVGHARTILIGAFLLLGSCVLATLASDTWRMAATMFILGAGWNFCFVAGSSLLTDSLRPNERPRIQGTNDLLVGLVAATGSLSGGFMFATVGYVGIALAGILLAVSLFGFTLWMLRRGMALPQTRATR